MISALRMIVTDQEGRQVRASKSICGALGVSGFGRSCAA
jgi:hypothetical protein